MSERPTILLVGANGQLGTELRPALAPLGELVCAVREPRGADELRLDLADVGSVRDAVETVRPAVVVNAAAYTAVDRAESEPEAARVVNEAGPAALARSLVGRGATLVHYSTDYVFDGALSRPYREEDAPRPLGVYARTKLAGERAVTASGVPHFVLRTGWLYAAHGRNFVATILARWRDGLPLRVVDDQTGTPTWARSLARVSAAIVARTLEAEEGWSLRHGGVYHVAAAGSATWLEFARAILACHGEPHPGDRVTPIRTADFGAAAPRPPHSVLDCSRLAQRLGLSIGHWRTELEAMVRAAAEHT